MLLNRGKLVLFTRYIHTLNVGKFEKAFRTPTLWLENQKLIVIAITILTSSSFNKFVLYSSIDLLVESN